MKFEQVPMDKNKENILWNNFKDGYSDSFRSLFDHFYPSLCEYAFQITGDRMDAEDIVLDLFIFIWKNSDRINIGKSIRSYLFTAVRNRAVNHLRSVKPESLDECFDIPVFDPALSSIDVADISMIICAALETVSERGRLIWHKKRDEGKTNAQIADELDVSEKTVEADVTKIRKILHIFIKRNLILTLFFIAVR